MLFKEFDQDALTTTMMIEYMLGNTDYSIWTLHNVVIVQDKTRRFFPVPYDFDSSGMVNVPYAAPDQRLHLKSITDRLYRGPCRTVEEFNAAAEPFRAHQADMLAAIESMRELSPTHKKEMKGYLESFFERIAHAAVDQADVCRRLSRDSAAGLNDILHPTGCCSGVGVGTGVNAAWVYANGIPLPR
jgi:hypothetical protein